MVNWGWGFIARFYDAFYSELMHQIDDDTIASLGPSIDSMTIGDIGAGTGTIDEKLINVGSARVIAVERDAGMRRFMRQKIPSTRLEIVDADMYDPEVFHHIAPEDGFDALLFRRSLYGSEAETKQAIGNAYATLKPGGRIYIVHPEADLMKYFDDGTGNMAASHVLRRMWVHFGKTIGAIQYEWYTSERLHEICSETCPDAEIRELPTSRPAYNFYEIVKPLDAAPYRKPVLVERTQEENITWM